MGKIILNNNQKRNIDIVFLLLASIFWGFGFVAIELVIDHGWSSISIVCLRGLFGGLICLPFSFKEKWWKNKKFFGFVY